ncbi:hypothetical protein RZS08_49140, partial [Arthrospira platensis SPKY1]|nr:hypothetical protein [Arthrospira platensis SPKY1]
MKLWDLQGREILSFNAQNFGLQSVAFSPDGRQMLTGGKNGSVTLWNLQGDAIQAFKHDDWVTSAVFSPDGRQILTGCKDNIARLWDLNGREIQTFQGHSAAVNTVCFSPD